MKAIRNYLILCLLLVMPLQSIAASFQLACQNNHKTSVTTETKMSHCHQAQAKENKQSKVFNKFRVLLQMDYTIKRMICWPCHVQRL